MITYTKRNVSFLAFLLTILAFLFIHFLLIPYLTEPFTKVNSGKVYTTVLNLQSESVIAQSENIHFLSSLSNLEELNNNSHINANKKVAKVVIKNASSNSQENQENSIILAQLLQNSEIMQNKQNSQNGQETTATQNAQTTQASQAKEKQNATQRQVVNQNKKSNWRIEIPKLNLNVHIKEGTSSNVLLQAVGHFEETSKWLGNVGLAAHNRGYQCNFFAKIKNLKIGDEIIYTTSKGKKVYKVKTNKVIPETDWSYLKSTQDNRLTLITCEANRREYRRCVQALEVVK